MSVEIIDEPTLSCQHCDKVFKLRMDLRRHQQVHGGVQRYLCRRCSATFFLRIHFERHQKIHERQDKIKECLKNDFNSIAKHHDHNANVDTQETHVNVVIHEIADETLQIQVTSEAIACPKADTQDPVPDFGKLSNNVIWIDSQSFSTINEVDWSLLGDRPEETTRSCAVIDSLA
ncbi:unnamed protein product [Orchesella dallaii]|uniref:C2H2-type domain-containing protein n=1 Tax=Orchesella dallaii TaxID=48710 RepID=A0ABP1S1Y6_9HEXA